ncbi:hypothetical protein MNBD_UNCLBAC01-1368 [hydrothermal vent metagenome]|uniref:FAD dependent oxidoreductase n=1 Tax=hydrothermal vent metagenome TaxID=652676 RepID=A0A3B1D7A2_9ZZZZ
MIEQNQKCDVAIVGAGVAGVCAAVTASRNGLKTLLIEKHDFPGGVAVAGMNRFICGLYNNYIPKKGIMGNVLNKGLCQEICEGLKKNSPKTEVVKVGKVYVFPFSTKDIVDVLWSLIDNEKNIIKCFRTHVVGAVKESEVVSELIVEHRNIKREIVPRAVIDCSGNSIISRMLSMAYQSVAVDQLQLTGYSVKVKGLVNVDDMLRVKVPYWAAKLVSKGGVPQHLKYTTFSPGENNSEGYMRINMPYSSEQDMINVARENMQKLYSFLLENLSEFKEACIEEMGREICEREGVRICGEYILTKEDVLNAKKFSNPAVKGAWPIEMWQPNQGPQYQYVKDNDYYEIPFECLKSASLLNLFAAGRCISVSHEALGSTRVMGTCMALGEAAGHMAVKYMYKNSNE